MPSIYVRDVPRDLYHRLKRQKEYLDCKTWVTFFYEVERVLREHLERENESRGKLG